MTSIRSIGLGLGLLLALPSLAGAQDARLWDTVLVEYARPGGFDYEGVLEDPEALRAQRAFIAQLATMPEEAPLADWLNAYNALVVHAVLERYPLDSVRSVTRFFRGIKYQVAGKARTLDDLEHGIIRPRFKDPRIHVALNCGAKSCPPLHGRAFTSATLDQTLDELSRRAVRNPAFVKLHEDSIDLSKIFFWYSADFEEGSGSILNWLKQYDTEGKLSAYGDSTKLRRMPYDWSLNRAPSAK
ncbi:MAG: DUF547 domain-containing protein [Myxococcota bacterium]